MPVIKEEVIRESGDSIFDSENVAQMQALRMQHGRQSSIYVLENACCRGSRAFHVQPVKRVAPENHSFRGDEHCSVFQRLRQCPIFDVLACLLTIEILTIQARRT